MAPNYFLPFFAASCKPSVCLFMSFPFVRIVTMIIKVFSAIRHCVFVVGVGSKLLNIHLKTANTKKEIRQKSGYFLLLCDFIRDIAIL